MLSYYCWVSFLRLALDWEAFLRFVFDPELPRSCVFESGLCFAAAFEVVSLCSVESGVVSTTSADDWGVVSASTVPWAVVSDSTIGSVNVWLPVSGAWFSSSCRCDVDLARDLRFASVFESGLRFAADFKVVSFSFASSGVVSTASAAAWGVVVTSVSGSVWAVVSVSTGTWSTLSGSNASSEATLLSISGVWVRKRFSSSCCFGVELEDLRRVLDEALLRFDEGALLVWPWVSGVQAGSACISTNPYYTFCLCCNEGNYYLILWVVLLKLELQGR